MNALMARRRHPLATLVVMLLALLATGAVYAVLSPVRSADAATSADADTVAAGRQLFLTNCSSCHGLSGQGSGQAGVGTADGPSLVGVGAAAVDFQVGTGRMPVANQGAQVAKKPVSFTDEEIGQLAAYVASLGPGPSVPVIDDAALAKADTAAGGQLYRTNCAMCHNFDAAGGALTEGKYAVSLSGVTPTHLYEAMLTGPQSMPVFGDASSLDEQDKLNIISYVKAVTTEESAGGLKLGSVGPFSEGLFAWTALLGSLIAGAVWLGQKAK